MSVPRDTHESVPAPATLSSPGGLRTEVSEAHCQRLGHSSLAGSRLQMCVTRKRHFSRISRETGRYEFWSAVAVKWG